MGEPCTVNGSASAGLQYTQGNFTDSTTSNRAEELFSEIISCSFCLEWLSSLYGTRLPVVDLFWQYFGSLTALFTYSSTWLWLPFHSRCLPFPQPWKTTLCRINWFCLGDHLHIYPHFMEDPTMCIASAAWHWHEEEQGLDGDKRLINPKLIMSCTLVRTFHH